MHAAVAALPVCPLRVCLPPTSTLWVVVRCGRSRAGCVRCALWAVSAAVLGGGVPCGVGKHWGWGFTFHPSPYPYDT